jgi:outer membrane receptor for ferrienterochelin and colicin
MRRCASRALATLAPAVVLVSLIAPSVFAQAGMEVTVYGASQKPAAGVEVLLENGKTRFSARALTNDQGKARFSPLSTAGRYLVRVAESDAYYEVGAADLELRSNFDRSVTLTLTKKATASEAITVSARPSVADVNAINAEVASTLGQAEIESLPIEGRDITRALYRLPNVTQATGFFPEAPNVSINGANSLYTNYMIDGLDNNENFLGGQKFALPVGFTQEITVLTGNYSVEFGRTGNGIFNLTSRSGGNALAGEVFYLTRPGRVIDASTPFVQRDLSGNNVKAGFQRHQAGFGLGGPVVADRTFYYVNAEFTRDAKDNLLSVPELGVNETVPGHNRFLYLSGKVDERWNDHLTSSFRVNQGLVTIERQGGGLDGGVTFPSAGNFEDRNSTLAALKTDFVSGSFVAETNLQYSRFRWNYERAQNPGSPQVTVLGAAGLPIAILGSNGSTFDDTENTLQLQEKVTARKGRHNLKFGVDVLSSAFALTGGGNVHGNYLVQLTQAEQDALKALGRGSRLSLTDLPSNVQVLDYNVELQTRSFGTRQNLLGLYAEDLFSASSNLNLTLGLRYDYDSLSKGGASSGDRDNLGPRASFNYQLPDRAVVRGGYGLFYDKVIYSIYSDALQQGSTAAGFRTQLERLIALGILPPDTDIGRVIFDGNLAADFTSGIGYLLGPGPDQLQPERALVESNELRILNPAGYPNPRTQQFTLGYQRQLGEGYLFYADLIHARSDRLPRLRELNAPAPYPIDPNHVVVRTPPAANATRPVSLVPGGALDVVITEMAGESRYYGASVNLVKDRRGSAYAYRISYTVSSLRNNTEDINFRAQDANNFAADWGPSINDRRHVVNAIGWYYPYRSFSVSVATLIQSGQPVNRIPDARIFGTTDLNGDGRSFADAYDGNSDRWPGESRNSDRLPWSFTVDLGLQYTIPLRGKRLEVRADVFNVTNHVNLSGYSNDATQSNQIQVGPKGSGIVEKNAGPPRQFQFGVRYTF